MRKIEMFLLLFFLALSVGAYVSCSHLPVDAGYAIGPGFMPKAISVLIAAAVLLRIVEIARLKDPEEGRFFAEGAPRRLLLAVVLLVLAVLGMETLGVYTSVFGFMLAVLLFISRHAIVQSLVASVATTAVFYLIFALWLKLPLPGGLLF